MFSAIDPGSRALDLDGWRPVAMKRLNGFEAPRLALLAFLPRPGDRFPVRSQDQARTCVRDFHPIATRFVDIEEKGLLDGVFVRARFDVDTVLQENIGGTENVLTAVDDVGEVMEAAVRPGVVERVGEVVTLVADGEPDACLAAIVQNDLLGEPAAEIVLKENTVRLDVDGE